jgi:hypothetical protein
VHDSDEIIDDNSIAQIIDMTEGFEEVTDDELPSTSHPFGLGQRMNNNQHLDIVCFDLGPDEQSWHMLSVKEIAAEKLIPIRNISEGLYNGCIGQVSSISQDNIVVNFGQRLVNMERCLFEIYDPWLHTI